MNCYLKFPSYRMDKKVASITRPIGKNSVTIKRF